MSCKTYRDALIEAAGSGAEPEAELGAHLAGCAGCREAFEEEQLLFSSIDAGLQRAANPEMPASLLPRVRTRLDEMPAGKNVWNIRWVTLASAAVIVAGVFATSSVWRRKVTPSPVEVVQIPSRARIGPEQSANSAVAPQVSARSSRPESHRKYQAATANAFTPANVPPEIRVSQDERVALADYAERLRRHNITIVLAQNFDAAVSPLHVTPIQIEELDVKPLAEGNSQ